MTKNSEKKASANSMDFLDSINSGGAVEEAKKPAANTLVGKALSANINNDFEAQREGEEVISISPDLIGPNPFQNRRRFKKIRELADKIKSKGQIQPCVVRKVGSRYELAAGERRKRACALLGIDVKVIVREMTDEEMRTVCTSENEDREDTNVIEKYLGMRELIDDKVNPKTYVEIAEEFSLSAATLTRVMKLNNAPQSIINKLAESQLADYMNFLRAEEIGNAFRDNPDRKEEIATILSQAVDLFELQSFDVESKQEEETNLTIKSFLHTVKTLSKSGSGAGSTASQPSPLHDLKIDNAIVGQLKTTGRSMTVTVKKEDMPEDLYNEFIEHIKSFFNKESTSQE